MRLKSGNKLSKTLSQHKIPPKTKRCHFYISGVTQIILALTVHELVSFRGADRCISELWAVPHQLPPPASSLYVELGKHILTPAFKATICKLYKSSKRLKNEPLSSSHLSICLLRYTLPRPSPTSSSCSLSQLMQESLLTCESAIATSSAANTSLKPQGKRSRVDQKQIHTLTYSHRHCQTPLLGHVPQYKCHD